MDGLVYPDRTPHTGLLEYKNVIRPVRAQLAKDGIKIQNMLDFTNLADYLTVSYKIACNGETLRSGSFDVDCAPGELAFVGLDLSCPDEGSCYLNLEYRQKKDGAFTTAGHIMGFDQLLLREKAPALPRLRPGKNDDMLELYECELAFTITGKDFRYVFSKIGANFSEMVYKNNNIITKPIEYNIWRAPTDNDRNIRIEWEKAGYNRSIVKVYSTAAKIVGGIVEIDFSIGLAPVYLKRILMIKGTWRIDGDGVAIVRLDCEKEANLPFLPRFGLRMFIPRAFDDVTYYGYGPHESYPDKHQASSRGLFADKVANMHEDYIKPQENGSHFGCDFMNIEKPGISLKMVSSRQFMFNASPYTQEELAAKKHNYELEPCGDTVICIDYAQSGIGSNSCGPQLMKKYQFNDEKFMFELALIPRACGHK